MPRRRRRTPRAPPRRPRSSNGPAPGPIAALSGPPPRARARRRTPSAIDPVREPAPAGVEHRHGAVAGDRDREAVGGQHHRRDAAGRGRLTVGLLGSDRSLARPSARSHAACRAPVARRRSRRRASAAATRGCVRRPSRSSSVQRPRFRLSYGPARAPPRRVVNSARAPRRSIARCSPLRWNGSGRPHCVSSSRSGTGVRCAYSKCARPSATSVCRCAHPPTWRARSYSAGASTPSRCCSSRRARRRGRGR